MSWKTFEDANPELAAFGAERLHGRVAYLATIRKDGSPRLHPMTPIIGGGHLFAFMEPTSPKGRDLRRDGHYAIHSSVDDTDGTGGEFLITGQAHPVDSPELRILATTYCTYRPSEHYVLFEFDVDSVLSTVYSDEKPVRRHWKRQG